MPRIETLVEDIQNLFINKHICSEDNVEELGKSIAQCIRDRLTPREPEPFRLRMSQLGKPPRQLWYDAHTAPEDKFQLSAKTQVKFLYGDILERVLLFLTKEAGHEVTEYQKPVEFDGVLGTLDARIDGVLVDCKSASTFSFKKFKTGSLREDDPFGYMWQLAGYAHADGVTDAGFLAIDKTLGDICFLSIPKNEILTYNVRGRIAELKEALANPDYPKRCYSDVPEGSSGNRKLGINCSNCDHKEKCWPGLETYLYANGPRFLTVVKRPPNVPRSFANQKEEETNG